MTKTLSERSFYYKSNLSTRGRLKLMSRRKTGFELVNTLRLRNVLHINSRKHRTVTYSNNADRHVEILQSRLPGRSSSLG